MKKLCLILIGMFLLNFISLSSVSAISIITHIPEKYQEVYPGERLYFEIEVKYPENPTRVDLRLNYIIEKDGQTVAQSKALKAVETQASFMDFLILPEDAEVSLHDLRIEVRDYGDLDEEVAELQSLYQPYLKLRDLRQEEADIGKFIEDNYNVQTDASCIIGLDKEKLRFVFNFLIEFSNGNYELS